MVGSLGKMIMAGAFALVATPVLACGAQGCAPYLMGGDGVAGYQSDAYAQGGSSYSSRGYESGSVQQTVQTYGDDDLYGGPPAAYEQGRAYDQGSVHDQGYASQGGYQSHGYVQGYARGYESQGYQAQGYEAQGYIQPAYARSSYGPSCPHGAGEVVVKCVYVPRPQYVQQQEVRLSDSFFAGGGGVGPDYIAGGGGGGGGFFMVGSGMASAGARASAYASVRSSVSVRGGKGGHGGKGGKGGCGCH